jgi:signal transduction histidine kinase
LAIADTRVSEPIELARRLHDTVAQRLAGLSYLLAAVEPRQDDPLGRCRVEIDAALSELRDVLSSVGSAAPRDARMEVAAELHALLDQFPFADLDCALDEALATEPRSLVATFLIEALRNCRKHSTPTRISVEVTHGPEVTLISVVNDGVNGRRGPSCGAGRRLLEVEASLHGGLIESTPRASGHWHQRLILPAAELRAA